MLSKTVWPDLGRSVRGDDFKYGGQNSEVCTYLWPMYGLAKIGTRSDHWCPDEKGRRPDKARGGLSKNSVHIWWRKNCEVVTLASTGRRACQELLAHMEVDSVRLSPKKGLRGQLSRCAHAGSQTGHEAGPKKDFACAKESMDPC
eukprot:261980-Pelagomonas_calceolata.AAC.3